VAVRGPRSSLRVVVVVAGALVASACSLGHGATGNLGGSTSPEPSAGSKLVRMVDYGTTDGPVSTAILTGAIGDYGSAVTVSQSGTVDLEHRGDLELKLSHGSFRLAIGAFHDRLIGAFAHFPMNTRTCSGSVMVTGTAPIVAGSGAGVYRGIRGAFDVTATISEVVSPSTCNASGAFLSQLVLISGSGIVSFG
jgi:hypothetical protein